LPSSNARPRPTDIKVDVAPDPVTGSRDRRQATIPLDVLQQAGVFPSGDRPQWQPQAWRVYFQTISGHSVPSALAPIQLTLRLETFSAGEVGVEERNPAELEWLPPPTPLPFLPPEDERGITGVAHFPMPCVDKFLFGGNLVNISFQPHPDGLRCIRFRWNPGPSGQINYPLDLHAGYHLLELDIDDFST
jgi:hypothetical protein